MDSIVLVYGFVGNIKVDVMHASDARQLFVFLNFEMLVFARGHRSHAVLDKQVAQTGTHHGQIEWKPLGSTARVFMLIFSNNLERPSLFLKTDIIALTKDFL